MINFKPLKQTASPVSRRTRTKSRTAYKVNVGLDVFGNAIPEVQSAAVEGTGKSLRIVKRQDVIVKPKTRRKAGQKSTSTALAVVKPNLLGRLATPWWAKKPPAHDINPAPVQQPAEQPHPDGLGERLEFAFKRLHHEFNEREERLEEKMRELKQEHNTLRSLKQKKRLWLMPVVLASVAVMGYMMYVMTSMQQSMTVMSGNINNMNGHMGVMAGDTQSMSQNMQYMNQSMYYMNNNVAYMSGNVAQMNQNVGAMSQAVRPMGEAASTMNPMMKMFKSFMPF